MSIISKNITIYNPKKPLDEFVEAYFDLHKLNVIRWAIVEVNEESLTLSIALNE